MKYMGSKRRIKKDIVQILQKLIDENDITTYIEPFVGGCNIIDSIKCDKRIGADNNEYLISLLQSLQRGYKPLDFISREEYYDIKLNKDSYQKEVVALCGIFASYNGNWFRAYGGYSKTKTGKDRNFYEEGIKGLMKQLPNLMEIKFEKKDYLEYNNLSNHLIYCDPPYENTDKTYKEKMFNHEEYWNWVRKMSESNIVICSEFNSPSDFVCIWEKEIQITHPNQKKKSTEKLFIHENSVHHLNIV